MQGPSARITRTRDFNLSIKTITESATTPSQTQYTNDLTATMLIAEDTNNIFRWASDGAPLSILGYKPWKTNQLDQYGYYANYFNEFTAAGNNQGYISKIHTPW